MTGFGFVAEISGDNILVWLHGSRGTGPVKQDRPAATLCLLWVKKPIFTEVVLCAA